MDRDSRVTTEEYIGRESIYVKAVDYEDGIHRPKGKYIKLIYASETYPSDFLYIKAALVPDLMGALMHCYKQTQEESICLEHKTKGE